MKISKISLRRMIIMGLMFGLAAGPAFASVKKIKIVADSADVYLSPDISSAVIANLKKGCVVTLASSRQFRKKWTYIYFSNGNSGMMKSGYVLESQISRLYQVSNVFTLGVTDKKQDNSSRKEILPPNSFFWGRLFVSLKILLNN